MRLNPFLFLGRLALSASLLLLLTLGPAPARVQAGGGPPLVLVASGVADDGLNGVMGKMATSVTCTNSGESAAYLVIEFYNYNNATFYSLTSANGGVLYTLAAGNTLTYSTQPTAAFYDDFSAGSAAIVQGYVKIFSDSPRMLCSAFLLDPTNSPPVFMAKLLMHTARGIPISQVHWLRLPSIFH
jgi:hypothetical protein